MFSAINYRVFVLSFGFLIVDHHSGILFDGKVVISLKFKPEMLGVGSG